MVCPTRRIASTPPLLRGRHDGVPNGRDRNPTRFDSARFECGSTLAFLDEQEHRSIDAPVHESRTSVKILIERCRQ